LALSNGVKLMELSHEELDAPLHSHAYDSDFFCSRRPIHMVWSLETRSKWTSISKTFCSISPFSFMSLFITLLMMTLPTSSSMLVTGCVGWDEPELLSTLVSAYVDHAILLLVAAEDLFVAILHTPIDDGGSTPTTPIARHLMRRLEGAFPSPQADPHCHEAPASLELLPSLALPHECRRTRPCAG
jgi:hypothetical protein